MRIQITSEAKICEKYTVGQRKKQVYAKVGADKAAVLAEETGALKRKYGTL